MLRQPRRDLAVAGEDDPGEVLAVGDGEPVGDGAGSAEAGTSLLKALRVIEKDRHRPLRPVRGQYRRRSGHDLDVEAQPLDELAPATPKQPRARVAGGSPEGCRRHTRRLPAMGWAARGGAPARDAAGPRPSASASRLRGQPPGHSRRGRRTPTKDEDPTPLNPREPSSSGRSRGRPGTAPVRQSSEDLTIRAARRVRSEESGRCAWSETTAGDVRPWPDHPLDAECLWSGGGREPSSCAIPLAASQLPALAPVPPRPAHPPLSLVPAPAALHASHRA
jgi:hypothetical protein